MKRVAEECLTVFGHVLEEISPAACVKKALLLHGNQLQVRNKGYQLHGNVRIVAVGKAAHDMVVGAETVLGKHVHSGIASVPIGTKIDKRLKTKFLEGAKDNLPDQDAVNNAKKIVEFLGQDFSDKDKYIVLFLISGGGSALLPAPINGVSLAEKLKTIKLLASNGADITELNTVRIALSELKGGKLASKAAPSKVISLIMSDIVGGHVDKVGSGPTIPQPPCNSEAILCLKQRNLWEKVPESIRKALERPVDAQSQELEDIQNELIADNSLLLQTTKTRLEQQGIATFIVNHQLTGDASEVGRQFAQAVVDWNQHDQLKAPFGTTTVTVQTGNLLALLYGGETTVSFPSNLDMNKTKGGRNQEMTLAFFNSLLKEGFRTQKQFLFMSLGSDGQDGPTDATGSFVCSEDLESKDPIVQQLDCLLENKNSYEFWSRFEKGERLVKTGKTGTNLMDMQILILG